MFKKLLLLAYLLTVAPLFSVKNFVLISAPGSGKGTFSQYLIQKYNYIQICPGDLLRAEILAQTELGKKIQPIVEKGEYIDEEITCQIITKHLVMAIQQNKPFIIDGFPRTKASLEFLDNFFKQHNLVAQVSFVQLVVNDKTCIKRIAERQVCNQCFQVYNRKTAASKAIDKCDNCQAPLALRKADTNEIAKQRLKYFHTNIEPLFHNLNLVNQHYNKQIIDAEQPLLELQLIYDNLIAGN